MITGSDLIAWGFKPGKWFNGAIEVANELRADGADDDAIFQHIQTLVPVELAMRTNGRPFHVFLDTDNEGELANKRAVVEHMDALMRVPTIHAGAVMPDACPSGSASGTIPVGGVVASTDIHPGMHSADICCSMAISVFKRNDDPKRLLDAVQLVTHFGPGGPKAPVTPSYAWMKDFNTNPFLKGLENFAIGHFGSQGDGNHFAFVGRLKSTGQLALVTHHGSRGLGAQLYKRGMAAAKKHTAIVAPRVPGHNAWIKADSETGRDYWDALQTVRSWTRANHFYLHDQASRVLGNAIEQQLWNEHNFVFRRSDGLFYHAKGATPSYDGFARDDSGLTLIPMNCAEPILITSHRNREGVLGFAPHGAGRNFSRTAHLKLGGHEIELARLQSHLDIRSFCGVPDFSELPSAYKNAAAVKAQIAKYDLADVVDEILPYGSIMAGDWERDAPWRRNSKATPSN